MRFTKMNGAGNDFILLDAIAEPFDESAAPALARALCDRRRSVGADGLMLVTRAEGDADYRMRFYNSDGSLGEMCGNGARCICRYGYARGYAGPVQRVETTAGLVTGWRITEEQYRIRLNTPSVVELEKQLDADSRTYRCSYVEPAVGPRRGLALVAVEADEERRAAVFLRHAGGHDAHHALVPALVRQHDRLRRPAGREHGDSGLINAAFDLLPPAVEAAERARQLDRASRVVR